MDLDLRLAIFVNLSTIKMSSLAGILEQALSIDEQARQNSQQLLQQEKQKSPETFCLELSRILASESISEATRQLAGILLKNTLLNLNNEDFLKTFWDSVTSESKNEIRLNALGTLACDKRQVRLSAAQAVSSIAKQDLSRNNWREIIDILVTNARNENLAFKEASLITLGYICDGLDASILNTLEVNSIISSIALSMTPSESNTNIKIIAFKAFKNSLRFAKKNFEVQQEREYIVQLISSGCTNSDDQVRIESFKLLLDVVNHYYDYVTSFLVELGRVTFQAVRQDELRVALLALEVWNSLGDIEAERKESPSPEFPPRGYMNAAVNDLIVLLLENMHRVQSEEDEWDINKACASVLTVLTQVTEDKVMDPCLEFIEKNIMSNVWQMRQAALMVIGSVVEGPSAMKISPIGKSIPVIVQLLRDENVFLKQSAAWTLSKMAKHQYKLMTSPTTFSQVLPALLETLNQSPKIACHVCWALINLIEKSSEIKLFKTGIFEHVFSGLINSAMRSDSAHQENNLQLAAFMALSTLIQKCSEDCVPHIEQNITNFIVLLKQHASLPSQDLLQNSLFDVISASFFRARPGYVSEDQAKAFIEALTEVFNNRNGVVEEGIMAIGSLAGNLNDRFISFLPAVGPFISFTLQKQDSEALCNAVTMLIGDIARALGDSTKPYVADFMQPLMANLRSDKTYAKVKVQSISSLCDVVAACKESTGPFLGDLISLIRDAATASVSVVKEEENPDLYEYLRDLREAIVEFYENFVQGLTTCADIVAQLAPEIMNYCMQVSQDKFRPRSIIHRCTLGIICDLCRFNGSRLRDILKVPAVQTYVQRYRTSGNFALRDLAVRGNSFLNSI